MRIEFESGAALDLDEKAEGRSPDRTDRHTVTLLGFCKDKVPDYVNRTTQGRLAPYFFHVVDGSLRTNDGPVRLEELAGMYAQFVSHDGKGSMFGWADPVREVIE